MKRFWFLLPGPFLGVEKLDVRNIVEIVENVQVMIMYARKRTAQ
jgi:hypothetical protein